MSGVNHQVIFEKRPTAAPTEDIFSFAASRIPQPGDDQFVIRNHYIAMDPALVSLKEDVEQGIDKAPAAFFRMLRGENEGKQLVRLISDEVGN